MGNCISLSRPAAATSVTETAARRSPAAPRAAAVQASAPLPQPTAPAPELPADVIRKIIDLAEIPVREQFPLRSLGPTWKQAVEELPQLAAECVRLGLAKPKNSQVAKFDLMQIYASDTSVRECRQPVGAWSERGLGNTMFQSWSPKKNILVTVFEHHVRLIDLQTKQIVIKPDARYGVDVAWHPSGDQFARLKKGDSHIHLVSSPSGKINCRLPCKFPAANLLAWAPNGKALAVSSWHDKKAAILFVEKRITKELKIERQEPTVLAFNSSGSILSIGTQNDSHEDQVRCFSGLTADPLYTIYVEENLHGLAFRPLHDQMIVMRDTGIQFYVNLEQAPKIAHWSDQILGNNSQPAWSPTGDKLVIGTSRDAKLKSNPHWTEEYSPSNPEMLASVKPVGWEGEAEQAMTSTNFVAQYILGARNNKRNPVSWSPDGTKLALANPRAGVDIIDMTASSRKRLTTLYYDVKAPVNAISWTPHGDALAASFADGSTHITQFASVKQLDLLLKDIKLGNKARTKST